MSSSLEETREIIESALNSFTGDFDKSALLEHIMQSLDDSGATEFDGWLIERHDASAFKGQGIRGQAKYYHGFIATHASGEVEYFPPETTGDVHLKIVKQILTQRNRLRELDAKKASLIGRQGSP